MHVAAKAPLQFLLSVKLAHRTHQFTKVCYLDRQFTVASRNVGLMPSKSYAVPQM